MYLTLTYVSLPNQLNFHREMIISKKLRATADRQIVILG